MSDDPAVECINKLSAAVADLLEIQAANNRAVLRALNRISERIDHLDAKLTETQKAVRALAERRP